MDRHYYLVAQLPTLFFDRPPAITPEGFLSEAHKWLSAREYAVLSRVDVAQTRITAGDPPALRRFGKFELHLRRELARWRQTSGTDREHRPAGIPPAALREGTPLEVEIRLLRWRWDWVDAEERGHDFDLELLVCYYLKLQILRRRRGFDPQVGLSAFQTLCEVEA
jgi:hypothetical protein